MALDVRIHSSNGYVVQLNDSTLYGLREGSSLGAPAMTRVFAETWGRGHHPLAGHSFGNREATLIHHLKGTSLDNWIVQYRQLEQILLDVQEYWAPRDGGIPGRTGARAWLSVQLNGMTNATVFDLLGGHCDTGALFRYSMTVTTAPAFIDVSTSLVLRPFGHPQTRTRTVSGTLNNGGGTGNTNATYTLTAPAGDVPLPVPLRLSFQSAAGDGFSRVLIGRKSTSRVANFIFAFHCETGTYTGYTVTDVEASGNFSLSNVAVAAAHGGNVLRITHTATGADTNANIIRITINDNLADFYGTYRVILRVDTGNTNVSDFSLTSGGASGTDIANAAVAKIIDGTASFSNSDFLVDLGKLVIPHRAAPDAYTLGEFSFVIRASMANAAFTADLDCIYLLPIDEEVADIGLSAAASAQDQIVWDGLAPIPAKALLDSSGDRQPETFTDNADTGFTLTPGVDNLFCVLVLDETSAPTHHDLTDQFTLAFEYFPQYVQAR